VPSPYSPFGCLQSGLLGSIQWLRYRIEWAFSGNLWTRDEGNCAERDSGSIEGNPETDPLAAAIVEALTCSLHFGKPVGAIINMGRSMNLRVIVRIQPRTLDWSAGDRYTNLQEFFSFTMRRIEGAICPLHLF
jgi:hypothetical protein